MTTRAQHLAVLYVLRWSRYRRSPHVMSQVDRLHEWRRLMAKKELWAEDGRMPIPDDDDGPGLAHLLLQAVGAVEDLEPTNQEAWLTIELLGHTIGFDHWRFLATYARNPWSWWESEAPGIQELVKAECRRLLWLLVDEFETRLNDRPKSS